LLIIIESPNKIKKIRSIVPNAKVVATVGHFKDLPSDKMSVDLTTYEPVFTISSGKTEVVTKLRAAAKGEDVIIATDPDREGYAIGTMAYNEVKSLARTCKRAEIHEITDKGVKGALAASVPFEQTNHGLYDAFLGRRVGDRLVGYILSPIASGELRGKYSVGRVQTPAVKLVVDREREIRAFRPEPFWVVSVLLDKDGVCFKAFSIQGTMKDKQAAEAIMTAVRTADVALAEKVATKEVRQNPKPPFTTVDMQATANSQLKIAPEKSMKLAQDLFEAGLISYHRTDSLRIADEFIAEIRKHVSATLGMAYLPSQQNTHKSKNSQADAHEAIRPTHMHSLQEVPAIVSKEGLTGEHERLYLLIYRRAVASQMAAAVFDATTMDFDVAGQKFRSKGRILKFDGFLAIYPELQTPEEEEEVQRLPPVSKGEQVPKRGEDLAEKMTKPPGRYTEGALVKALERLGIGRPSTYATIMQVIKARGYVKIEKGKLVPEPAGETIIDYLTKKHPWITELDLTRRMEEYLDKVEGREPGASWQKFCKGVHAKMGYVQPAERTAGGAPSDKALSYARDIARNRGIELPEEVTVSADACRIWLDSQLKKEAGESGKKSAKQTTPGAGNGGRRKTGSRKPVRRS